MIILQQIKNEIKKFNRLELDPTEPIDAAAIAIVDKIDELIVHHENLEIAKERLLKCQ